MYFLLPLLTVLIWSGNAIVSIVSSDVIEPGVISFYRWFIAFVVITPFLIKRAWNKRDIIKPHLWKLAILALLGMAINQSLMYFASSTTTATHMTLIIAFVPLLSLFFSIPLLSLTLSKRALLGAVISLTGLAYMMSRGNIASLLSEGISKGDSYMLIAACSYALYSVLLKRWKMPFNSWISLYIQIGFAVLMLTPVFLSSTQLSLSYESLPLVLYAALPTSVLAPWLWMQSIHYIGADKSAMFMNLLPIFTSIMAISFLGDQLETYQLIGGSFVLLGVIMTQINVSRVKLRAAFT